MPSQSLSLSQTQQLQMVLAPQLRQSLEMLQLPILELRAMIQQELEQNPTIEDVPLESPTVEIEPGGSEPADGKEMDFDKEFEVLAKLDDEWRDYFFQNFERLSYSSDQNEKRQFLIDSMQQRESLQEHLLNQLNLIGLSEQDRRIGEMIVGSINDDGYLTGTLEEMAQSANTDLDHLTDLLLSAIQELHPTGVGARDLRECLLIQLERQERADSVAGDIVRNHLDKLAARKFTEIAKALHVTAEDVHAAAKLIGTLDPKPGCIYSADTATIVLPEILVQKVGDSYVVILNDDQLPRVRISNHYRRLMSDPSTKPEVKAYIQERVRAGAFLIKSIHQRQKTIQRIATEIVNTQTPFLDHGISHLKPLTMAEIADVVGVHETTVSRTVSGKYMQTPVGVFELKYFFTPGIKTTDGQQVSNKTVKDMIANLVANEDPDNPCSDQELVAKLVEKGIKIARRTVAKYRLILNIAPSHLRKDY